MHHLPMPFSFIASPFNLSPSSIGSTTFKYGFNIDRDIDFITHDNPASVHRILPADAKVLAIDPRRSEKTRARLRSLVDSIFPPRRLPLSQVADVQDGAVGHATNC